MFIRAKVQGLIASKVCQTDRDHRPREKSAKIGETTGWIDHGVNRGLLIIGEGVGIDTSKVTQPYLENLTRDLIRSEVGEARCGVNDSGGEVALASAKG